MADSKNSKKATDATEEKSTEDTSDGSVTHNTTSGKANRNFTLAIVAAILVALALIALGFMAYNDDLGTGEDSADTEQAIEGGDNQQGQSAELEGFDTQSPVTNDDLQSEVEALDQDLSELNQEDEFDESELSDEQLNL